MTKDERILRAREVFLQGYNCSQSVFCAYADDYDMPLELALRVSASLGGGIARMRETCGAVCGMAMLVGMEEGQTQPNDLQQKQKNYQIVQNLASRFREMHGSIKCSELLQLRKDAPITAAPDERTADYYKKRPCLQMIESAVAIYEDWKDGRVDDRAGLENR